MLVLDEGRVLATLDDCAYAAPGSPSCAYIPVAYGNGDFLNATGAQQVRGVGGHGRGARPVAPAIPPPQVSDMALLAQRDRNHASVAWYSLCNECGCGDGSLLFDTVPAAKAAVYS